MFDRYWSLFTARLGGAILTNEGNEVRTRKFIKKVARKGGRCKNKQKELNLRPKRC